MIHIERPKVISDLQSATLQSYITIDKKRELVWFKVDKKHEQYLCYERADAFLILCLNYAMRNAHDIKCDAPVSEELYYNIEKILIPGLISYNPSWHKTIITAEVTNESLPCAGAVATGISCGVDSFHALSCQTNLKFKNHNITHLTFNNVGSHGEGEKAEDLYKKRLERPKQFAEKLGYEFVPSNSNVMNVIEQNHFRTHTYSSMFAVYCLQKLYSVYYYASSGYKYHEFNLVDKSTRGSGSYELWSLPLLSTSRLRIYSEGDNLTRMDKLKEIITYEPSHKYLNVCLRENENCGTCEKCVRTLLGLDVLGALDNYSSVFDINYYHSHKKWYLQQMLYRMKEGKHDYFEMYPHFKHLCTPIMHIKAFIWQWKIIQLIRENYKIYSFVVNHFPLIVKYFK